VKIISIDFNVDDTQPSLYALLARTFGKGSERPVFNEDIEIDLTTCGFLGPMAVVTICGLRKLASSQGFLVTIRPPKLRRLAAYCEYSGLLAEFQLGPPPSPHPESMTSPVAFFNVGTKHSTMERVVHLAQTELSLSQGEEHDLALALAELQQNVIDHSDSFVGGIVSARAYKNEREIRFAVADMGIGIRERLSRNQADPKMDDADAIQLALKEHVSSRSSAHNMGLGLSHLHRIVQVTRGRLVIYSGRGFLTHENGRDRTALAEAAYPGTVVFVRLPIRAVSPSTNHDLDIWS
jgi:anti-sigma regulatory factor (Ser/Thr protein kinase)